MGQKAAEPVTPAKPVTAPHGVDCTQARSGHSSDPVALASPQWPHGCSMIALMIFNATRVLAESQDEYHPLAIRDEIVEGHNHMISLWQPTPSELADLNRGGHVRLQIIGSWHPPVILTVQPMGAEDSKPRKGTS